MVSGLAMAPLAMVIGDINFVSLIACLGEKDQRGIEIECARIYLHAYMCATLHAKR